MSAAQQQAASRLIRGLHDLAEAVRLDHVPGTGRQIAHLPAPDLYRLLPGVLRRAVHLADVVGTNLTRCESTTLRAVANLIEKSAPAAPSGYCEHCGSGPVCVVYERGVIG